MPRAPSPSASRTTTWPATCCAGPARSPSPAPTAPAGRRPPPRRRPSTSSATARPRFWTAPPGPARRRARSSTARGRPRGCCGSARSRWTACARSCPTSRTEAEWIRAGNRHVSTPQQGWAVPLGDSPAPTSLERAAMSTPYWGPDFDALAAFDPDIAGVVLDELDRLRGGLQLIASENFTSPAVLAALGSTLSNKYPEGYPGARYYGGCEVVDRAESIGIERAKELFGAEHANLQPHSGANANLAAYGAFLQPGDTFLAMALPHGGHLTHGAKVSFSGKWFNAVQYGVNPETEHIDYDQVRDLAREHRPKMIICGGSAIPRLIDFAAFREIADEVGAILMVDAAHFIGLVAGKAIPS